MEKQTEQDIKRITALKELVRSEFKDFHVYGTEVAFTQINEQTKTLMDKMVADGIIHSFKIEPNEKCCGGKITVNGVLNIGLLAVFPRENVEPSKFKLSTEC